MDGKPYSRRFNDLEERFTTLASKIPDGPEKEGISVLHGMVQELWRNLRSGSPVSTNGLTLEDIADLYKTAPPMDGDAENQPLPGGWRARAFGVMDPNGQTCSLSEFRGRPLVLVFYPLDWSPTCSDQLSLYQSELEEFKRLGVEVGGISGDSITSHGLW